MNVGASWWKKLPSSAQNSSAGPTRRPESAASSFAVADPRTPRRGQGPMVELSDFG